MSYLMRTYKPQIMFKATKPQNTMFLKYSFCFSKCLQGFNNPVCSMYEYQSVKYLCFFFISCILFSQVSDRWNWCNAFIYHLISAFFSTLTSFMPIFSSSLFIPVPHYIFLKLLFASVVTIYILFLFSPDFLKSNLAAPCPRPWRDILTSWKLEDLHFSSVSMQKLLKSDSSSPSTLYSLHSSWRD